MDAIEASLVKKADKADKLFLLFCIINNNYVTEFSRYQVSTNCRFAGNLLLGMGIN